MKKYRHLVLQQVFLDPTAADLLDVEQLGDGDIVLGKSGRVITNANFPHLSSLVGRTLVTTDGMTLLGADVPNPIITGVLGHTSIMSIEPYLGSDMNNLRKCVISIEGFPMGEEVLQL